jgi:hypothetical protein
MYVEGALYMVGRQGNWSVMIRTAAQSKTDEAAKGAERKPVPPPHLPKHLKPLTGPTGMKPSY